MSLTREMAAEVGRNRRDFVRLRCIDGAGRYSRQQDRRIVWARLMEFLSPSVPPTPRNDSIFAVLMYGSMDDLPARKHERTFVNDRFEPDLSVCPVVMVWKR